MHTAVNENRITAYQFTILFAHRWRGHALSRVVSRVHAKKAVCVLDTYRQSEIYVAQGESGALKYYRFASRLHIHAWAGRRGWKNWNREREREREKEWRGKRDEKARGEDKEEVDGVEEKYRGRRRVRNRNGETWRGGNVETVIPESGIKKNLVVWRKMWGGGDRGSWTEGRYRWMVKAEEWRKEGGGCEKKCNARTCRPITCHFYRRIHSFPLLEFILRSTIAIYGACERWIIVALGTKWHFLSLRASLLTRLKKNENGRRRMENGNLLLFFFFSSRMNQTIERMGLSRSILRFYLRVIRSWRKMFRDEIRCLRETFFLCSEYICIWMGYFK